MFRLNEMGQEKTIISSIKSTENGTFFKLSDRERILNDSSYYSFTIYLRDCDDEIIISAVRIMKIGRQYLIRVPAHYVDFFNLKDGEEIHITKIEEKNARCRS